jgi:hypothetical protein
MNSPGATSGLIRFNGQKRDKAMRFPKGKNAVLPLGYKQKPRVLRREVIQASG